MSVRNMELTWNEQLKGQEQYWNSILQTSSSFPGSFFSCLCWIMMIQISITSTKAWALSKIAQGCESQGGGGCGENGNWDTHTHTHTHSCTHTHKHTHTNTHTQTHSRGAAYQKVIHNILLTPSTLLSPFHRILNKDHPEVSPIIFQRWHRSKT